MQKAMCPKCKKKELEFSHNTQVPLELTTEGKLKPSTNVKEYTFFDNGLHVFCSGCNFDIDEVTKADLLKIGLALNTDNYIIE